MTTPDLVFGACLLVGGGLLLLTLIFDDLFGSGPVHMVNRWSRVTETGVEGDPMLATPEKGKAFAECAINNLVEFARQRGAMAIVKGLRAISDFEYELEMNQLNRRQAPEIESVYLMASAKYSFLRSSGVKELATFGGEIDELVPDEVAKALKERLSR